MSSVILLFYSILLLCSHNKRLTELSKIELLLDDSLSTKYPRYKKIFYSLQNLEVVYGYSEENF